MPLRRRFAWVCAWSVLAAAIAAAQPRLAPPVLGAAPRASRWSASPSSPVPGRGASHWSVPQLLRNAQPYLLSPAAVPAAASSFTGEDAIQLYHLRYEQVVPCGLSALVIQRVFQIRSRAGAELFVPDNLWYDSARGHFQLLRAEVWRRKSAHGSYTVVGRGRDRGDLPGFALGTQPRQIGLPPLQAGDRVSLLYLVLPVTGHAWSALDGHFIGNMFALRDSFATRRVRYVLAARAPMAVSASGLPAPVHRVRPDGLQTWQWEATDQAAFFQASGGPAITEVSPFVQVSGFTTWAAMANWYAQLLRQRSYLSPQLDAQLRALARPVPVAPGDAARARVTVARIWSYLSAHLAYQGDEDGVHAYVPSPVGQVFRSGKGDCKDGALLLATWLRAVGIQADLALVRTPAMGPLAPSDASGEVAATMAAFDHALVYVPITGQWIDTTAPHRLDTELPTGDQNSLALIVRRGQRGLVRVPQALAAANLTRSQIRLTPSQPGWLSATGSIKVRGARAPALRARYAQVGARNALLQSWLRTDFPGAKVTAVTVRGVQPAAPVVQIQFRAQIPRRQFQVAWMREPYAQLLAPQTARHQPLELPLRWENDQTWALAVPGDQACSQPPVPAGWHRRSRFGQAAVDVRCGHGWLSVHVQVRQTARQILPADYRAFRSFWQSVEGFLDQPMPAPARPVTTVAVAAREH